MYTIRLPFFLKLPLKNVIWRKKKIEKTVYLTFDDGPIPEITPWVLDVLNQENIKATFFCVGENVQKHPKIYNQILSQGHHVGHHTYNHLPSFKVKNKAYLENVKQASKWVKTNLFRPPHGQIRLSQILRLRKQYRIILWDVLSADFDPKISPEKCLKNVTKHTRNGSIIVFHDSLKAENNLKYTLPKAIKHLKKQGYNFELL